MTLKALIEKGSDDDLLREMIGFLANRTMDMEVEGLTGASWNERSVARTNHRNGYRERAWVLIHDFFPKRLASVVVVSPPTRSRLRT